MPEITLPEEELPRQLRWFVRIRWIFLAGLAAATFCGARLLHLDFPVGKTVVVGGVVFAYNLTLWIDHRLRGRPRASLRASRIEAAVQIGLDLAALTALVHFTGGVESPFVCLYVIHAIAGTLLLPRREAWLVGATVFGLFLSVALAEQGELLPHFRPLSGAGDHPPPPLSIAASFAFLITLLAAMSITQSIRMGLRLREKQLVQAQEALLKKSRDLEEACKNLTEQQKQLVQAEKQASLGRLVAGIAHEINNPIQFIHGNMSILSEAFTDLVPILDEQERAQPGLRVARLDYPFFRRQLPLLLQDMAGGASRIRAIVRDLKSFARKDEGRLDEEVDLNEVVRGSLRLLHNQLKRLEVREELAPELPKLRGNLTQLQQVVVNSLQNAIEAVGKDGSGRIRVATRPEQAGAWVRLSVEDNGCGIPDELRDRIFDPFFTTKSRTGGTGLGLAITEGIVEQHRGRIELESRVGQGATFHFLLPREWSATPLPPPPAPKPAPPQAPPLPKEWTPLAGPV